MAPRLRRAAPRSSSSYRGPPRCIRARAAAVGPRGPEAQHGRRLRGALADLDVPPRSPSARTPSACWARLQALRPALTLVTVMLQAAWALARRRALDDGASAKATGLLLCLGAGDACAALLGDFARGPALGLMWRCSRRPASSLSSSHQGRLRRRRAHKSMAGALASLGSSRR